MQNKTIRFYIKATSTLGAFLLKHYGSSPTKLKKLIKSKSISLNGTLVKQLDSPVQPNDVIEIFPQSIDDKKSFDIVYEDKNIIAINKPAGLLSVTDAKNSENLFSQLKEKMGRNIFVVHRIDKSVSGLILFTKNIEAQRHLENNWKSYTKQYYAIVEKKISPSQKILKNKLTTNGPNLVFINDNAQNAVEVITEYETIKSDERYSELLITLHTGKKNQIRAQLSHHGNPIIGDTKFSSNYPLKKYILLHSWRISLTLPDSTKAITLEACIPDYFKNYQPKGQTNENT